jgi:hypothetical protein
MMLAVHFNMRFHRLRRGFVCVSTFISFPPSFLLAHYIIS